MISNKEKYKELCKSKDIPLFFQYFWIGAICGADNWNIILVEENNNVLGAMTYFLINVEEGYEIRKAPLNQNNGIIYVYLEKLKYEN